MRSTGYIGSDGKYHKGTPDLSTMKDDRTSIDKQYSHDRQRESHRRELIQPYKGGQPNPEFVSAYPQESQEVYGFVGQ